MPMAERKNWENSIPDPDTTVLHQTVGKHVSFLRASLSVGLELENLSSRSHQFRKGFRRIQWIIIIKLCIHSLAKS